MDYMTKESYVADYLAPLLKAAKGPDWSAEFLRGEEILAQGPPKTVSILAGDEYVIASAPNGYRYFIDVTADSFCAIAYDTISALLYK
jgi:hypothetical protein